MSDFATQLVNRAFSQRGPMLGGRGPGRPWNGIVESTPVFWVTWVTQICKQVNISPDSLFISWGEVPLRFDSVELTFGTRWYWLCPNCGRRCEAVYRTRRVGCRECLHLGYLSQSHRPTSALAVLDKLFLREYGTYHPGVYPDVTFSSRHYPTANVEPLVKELRKRFEAQLKAIIEAVEVGPVLPDDTRQALGLAQLLIDWELENPQVNPPPEGWQRELRAARQALGELNSQLD